MKDVLKKQRKKLKFNQIEFAAIIGSTQATLSRVESGKFEPDIHMLTMYHLVTGLNINKLLRGKL